MARGSRCLGNMLMHLNCLDLRLAGYNTRSNRSLGHVEPRGDPGEELELPRVTSTAAARAQAEREMGEHEQPRFSPLQLSIRRVTIAAWNRNQ